MLRRATPTPSFNFLSTLLEQAVDHYYQTIVDRAESKSIKNTFVIGLRSVRQTVHAQQLRACNLVAALFATKRLGCESNVVVIGGGIAGMTAAAAAAVRGAQSVTLLERQPCLLHLQRGNQTRWLHPNIYDWPDHHSLIPRTRLPFLNWKADTAGKVASCLLREWDELVSHCHLPIDVRLNCSEVRIADNGASSWNDDSGHHHIPPATVIVATGFGVERTIDITDTPSYWHNDNFSQPSLTARSGPRRILVSGTGDGGLLDVLRLRIHNFDHTTVVTDFFPTRDPAIRNVVVKLRSILTLIQNGSLTKGPDLLAKFETLDSDVGIARVDARLRPRLRTDTQVILNGSEMTPITPRASLLHSFLIWRLLKMDLRYVAGEVVIPPKTTKTGTRVEILTSAADASNPTPATLCHVEKAVFRHGASDPRRSLLNQRLAEEIETNEGLGDIAPDRNEEILKDFLVGRRWRIDADAARRQLEHFGLRAESTELRNRWILREGSPPTLFVEDGHDLAKRYGSRFKLPVPTYGWVDVHPSPGQTLPWRASVIALLIEELRDNPAGQPKIVLFRGPLGSGKSLLWWRFMSSQHSATKECLLLDYAAAVPVDLPDVPFESAGVPGEVSASTGLYGGVEVPAGLGHVKQILKGSPETRFVILDNFAQGIRAEYRRSADARPYFKLIERHLNEVLESISPSSTIVIVVDTDDHSVFERSLAEAMKGLDRAKTTPLTNVSLIPHPCSDKVSQETQDDVAEVKVGGMLKYDALRILGKFHNDPSMGRNSPEDQRKQKSLFSLFRPIAEYHHDLMGFRTHPLLGSVLEFDLFLRQLEPYEKPLRRFAALVAGYIESPARQSRDLAQEQLTCWQTLCGDRLHLSPWLAAERTVSDCLIAAEELAEQVRQWTTEHSKDQEKRSQRPLLHAFAGLALVLCDVKLDDGTLVVRPRAEVSPMVYSNLISILSPCGDLSGHLPGTVDLQVENFWLTRPVLKTLLYKRVRFVNTRLHDPLGPPSVIREYEAAGADLR